MRFYIQPGYDGRERNAVTSYACRNKIPVMKNIGTPFQQETMVPVGSVEFCEGILGRNVKPEYFPDFVKPILRRKIIEGSVFVKPTDRYKRFAGHIETTGARQFQEVVHWENEFRLYIANGKEVAWGWYNGSDEDAKAPHLIGLSIPKDWCGTIDIGTSLNEHGGIEVEVVECHHPYACCWYGEKDDGDKYVEWLINGWKYMNERYK